MGIIDIFYNEINNIRNKYKTKKEAEKHVKSLLKKLLRRYVIDWEQFAKHKTASFYNKSETFFVIYRENFLDILVEIEEYLDSDTINSLKNLCDCLEEGQNTIPTMGGHKDRRDFGDKANNLAEDIINRLS